MREGVSSITDPTPHASEGVGDAALSLAEDEGVPGSADLASDVLGSG